jgi:hypothetical protein
MLDELIVRPNTTKNINNTAESNKRYINFSTNQSDKLSHCHFSQKSKFINISDLKLNKVAETNSNFF